MGLGADLLLGIAQIVFLPIFLKYVGLPKTFVTAACCNVSATAG